MALFTQILQTITAILMSSECPLKILSQEAKGEDENLSIPRNPSVTQLTSRPQ